MKTELLRVVFHQGADRVALVFALDQSGSLREVISQQRDAALALFGRFGERSRVAVLLFAESLSQVYLLVATPRQRAPHLVFAPHKSTHSYF